MSTFTREEITFFREQYANHLRANARGVDSEGFVSSINICLTHAGLHNPGPDTLRVDFNKIKNTDGNVSWPQFFQALQKIRNTPQPVATAAVARQQQVSEAGADLPGAGSSESGPRSHTLRRTLRRGTVTALTHVGNWFGVAGGPSDDNVFFDEAAIVEQGQGQGRRRSTLTRYQQAPPPPPEVDVHYVQDDINDGPADPFIIASPSADLPNSAPLQQSSFAFVDFEGDDDDSDEETEEQGNFLMEPPPPNYLDIVAQQPPRPSSLPPARDPTPLERPRERRSSFDIPPEVLPIAMAPEQIPQREAGFIYDPQLAFQYYQSFVKEERKTLRNRAQQHARSFFGGDNASSEPAAAGLQRNGPGRSSTRADRISARERGWRERLRLNRNTRKLQRQSTMVRQEVESLPSFCPFFTILITVAQIACCIVILILNNFAPLNIRPEIATVTVPSLADSQVMVTKEIMRSTNMWAGPRVVHMIQWGAKFKPCMRGDLQITQRNSRSSESEAGPLGCCCNGQFFGSVVEGECGGTNNTAFSQEQFFNNTNCFGFTTGGGCQAQDIRPGINATFFRPCCVSITGACALLSPQECALRNGYSHPEAESCRDVNCLRDVCGFTGAGVSLQQSLVTGQGEAAAEQPNQFWRWVLPMFFHLGLIHLVMVMAVQVFLGVKIELYAGWLRIGIIYFISALGGLLVSAIFIPYEVYFGASGAVCGLLAVYLIELLQKWKIKDYAILELIIFVVLSVIIIFIGTFPYVDNFAHFGGFLFGLLAALIFLPWVSFTKNTQKCRCIILLVAGPTLLLLTVFAFLVFYLLPDAQSSFCPWCHYINCVPYFEGLCDITNPSPGAENLASVGL